jgi:hypothetical protein
MLIPSRYHMKKRYTEDQFEDSTIGLHDQYDENYEHKEYGAGYEHHIQITDGSSKHTTIISEEDLYEAAYLRGEFDEY